MQSQGGNVSFDESAVPWKAWWAKWKLSIALKRDRFNIYVFASFYFTQEGAFVTGGGEGNTGKSCRSFKLLRFAQEAALGFVASSLKRTIVNKPDLLPGFLPSLPITKYSSISTIYRKGKQNTTKIKTLIDGKVETRVDLKLMLPLLSSGHILKADNLHTSQELFKLLLDSKTDGGGAVRTQKKVRWWYRASLKWRSSLAEDMWSLWRR